MKLKIHIKKQLFSLIKFSHFSLEMGNQNYRSQMSNALDISCAEKIIQIIKDHPEVLDEDLSNSIKVTPLARAVWRNDFQVTDLLIKQCGANVNNGGSQSITPLMWAAIRDNAYMVSNLIDYGAEINLKSNQGLTAMDYAIVHGNYRPALFLFDFNQEIRDTMVYTQFAKEKDYRYVNYEIFISHLKNKVSYQQVPNFFQRPQKKKLIDPVIDPRESWREMFSRLKELQDPPLVHRYKGAASEIATVKQILGKGEIIYKWDGLQSKKE